MRLTVTAALVLTAACVGGGQRVYRVAPLEACPGQRLLEVTVSRGTVAYVHWRTPGDSSRPIGVLLGATAGTRRFKIPAAGTPVFTTGYGSPWWSEGEECTSGEDREGNLRRDCRPTMSPPDLRAVRDSSAIGSYRYLCRVPIAADSVP